MQFLKEMFAKVFDPSVDRTLVLIAKVLIEFEVGDPVKALHDLLKIVMGLVPATTAAKVQAVLDQIVAAGITPAK